MKKATLAAVVAFLTLAAAGAFASGIEVSPLIPVSCQQPTLKQVTWVQVQPGETGDTVTFDLTITHGTCRLGQQMVQTVADDFSFYLINHEYSRDFESSYSLATAQDLTVHLSLRPSEFFALQNDRHFDLAFYPDGGSLAFNFSVVISRDPSTQKVVFQLLSK